MSFGRNLERIRKEKKVSQSSLGKAIGLTQQMISSYEKDASSPNIEVLVKIANYFNLSIDNLVGHVVNTPEANSKEARFLRYFQSLNGSDQEKCILIAQTILEYKDLSIKPHKS